MAVTDTRVETVISEPVVGAGSRALSPGQQVWRRFKRDRLAIASGIFLALLFTVSFLGPPLLESWLGRPAEAVNPNAQILNKGVPVGPDTWALRPDAPTKLRILPNDKQLDFCKVARADRSKFCWYYPLGADGNVGHDELSWLVKGARTSLEVAIGATFVSIFIGVLLGSLAGYLGGFVDGTVSRVIEIIMAFPITLFIVALAAVQSEYRRYTLFGLLPRGALLVIVVISAFGWYYPARVIRGQVLSLKEKEFVEAARMLGASPWRVVRSHLLPFLVAPVIVYSTLIIGQNVLAEAGLSFLSVGIDGSEPSWGNLLETSADLYRYAPLVMVLPGVCLLALTLATNILGDGLRDAFDPRSNL